MGRWFGWCVLGLIVASAALGWWVLQRPRDEFVLRLPEGTAVAVPETDVSLRYQGVGFAMTTGGDCEPFISYAMTSPDQAARTHYDSLDGLRLPPWRVVAVAGEWGLEEPSTPLLERLYYRVFPDEEPDSLVAVRFERLEP